MKSKLFTLFFLSIFSMAYAQDEPEDFKIISQLLFELEQRNWLPRDIYPILPPPPVSRAYFIELRDDLTPELADSLFTIIEERYNQNQLAISERQVDSTFIFMATGNYLLNEKCKGCGIKPDTLNKDPNYSRYKQLVKSLKKGKMNKLKIPFDEFSYKGKYQLKSVDEFPPAREMYDGKLNFLSGGELDFSRFYQKEDLWLIYFSISSCQLDCSAGYIVLYERKNGEWELFDILMQWAT